MLKLYVTCPAGVEELLAKELQELGGRDIKLTVTGATCSGEIDTAYRICLWSRLANRVLLLLAEKRSGNATMLYDDVHAIDWLFHLGEGSRLRVDFNGTSDAIRNSLYGARVTKDAIVDSFTEAGKARPNIDLENPQHRVNVRLTRKSLYISLDLSGDSLHKRHYRKGGGAAPIKENLAAALLMRARWPEIAALGGGFVDPMCGSGTFLIEAAMMAADIAPGLLRKGFGFEHWLQHDASRWETLKKEALERKAKGIQSIRSTFHGCEIDAYVAEQARENIIGAGLESSCSILNSSLTDSSLEAKKTFAADSESTTHSDTAPGLVVVNPPYGMRLGEAEKLTSDYFTLAQCAKERFPGWSMGILSSNRELLAETRLRFDRKYRVFNGAIECEFRTYTLKSLSEQAYGEPNQADAKKRSNDSNAKTGASEKVQLSESALMVANRLQKNLKKLKKWRDKHNISCFRAYDADLPEYSAAIDIYNDKLHIQQYQAPRTVEPEKARLRFDDLVTAAADVFNVSRHDIYIKTRKRNRGTEQYQKQFDHASSDQFVVQEGRAKLVVNLKSYLDTGLFLDHRPLRLRIAEAAKGKRFLNLFSYTSSASVHAILGGASASTSVDMSNTYIAWSKQNFEMNNIRGAQHALVRADVLEWLRSCRQGFDVIMLDPPSFSNSKKMQSTFDIQRDHISLVKRCMELLSPTGTLYFSNNLRSFKMDSELEHTFKVDNITQATIDLDFQRNSKIHHCFEITHPN